MKFDFQYTKGVQKKQAGEYSSTEEIENSVNVAVTASYEAGDAGGASASMTLEYGHRVMNAVSQVSSWENTESTEVQTLTKDITIQPGQTVKVYQIQADFESDLASDEFKLFVGELDFREENN